MILGKEEMERIEELKRNEEILYKIINYVNEEKEYITCGESERIIKDILEIASDIEEE